MCHLKHRLRFFLFCRNIMFRSQDIQVFLTIPWFTKSMTSRWVLVHEIRCIFEYNFWTTTHEVTKLGQLIDINKCNNCQYSFEQFGGQGLDPGPFNLATCPNYSITKYVKMPVFHFLKRGIKDKWKLYISTIKNGQILLYCHFNKIIKWPGTSFRSPAFNQKHVRNVYHIAH